MGGGSRNQSAGNVMLDRRVVKLLPIVTPPIAPSSSLTHAIPAANSVEPPSRGSARAI